MKLDAKSLLARRRLDRIIEIKKGDGMSKGWIGVDLDGTLAHYDGWKGPDHIGEPILKILERVKLWMAFNKYEIRIFTARAGIPEQIPPVVAWLEKHGIGGLAITNIKDFSMVELWDDRCVQIISNLGISVQEHAQEEINTLEACIHGARSEGDPMRIYVASSWRNPHQQVVVRALRSAGHEVYDFRNPSPGNHGFAWSDIDPDWLNWSPEKFRDALKDQIAIDGFTIDMKALRDCDACVLVLPCGRSAHLELGWAAGAGKRTGILILDPNEPELMYRMLDGIYTSIPEMLERVGRRAVKERI